jgi:hypothetical protein
MCGAHLVKMTAPMELHNSKHMRLQCGVIWQRSLVWGSLGEDDGDILLLVAVLVEEPLVQRVADGR